MRLSRLILLAGLSLLGLMSPAARAELVVVAHPDSGIGTMTRDEVINIYLGRFRRLASGQVAEPIDAAEESVLRSEFYLRLVGKSLPEINAYWARLVFSGKTRPPQVSASIDAALRVVASKTSALAYVPRDKVDGRVRVVFAFPE